VRCKAFAFILAVLALGSLAGAAAPPTHVKATLLADVKQIVPGKPFHLGVMLEIDPGWHTYWLNPGDSGMATKITLDLPKGFVAGDVQFPTPIKIVDPGNINVYGYTDKVMFIATVTPDNSLAAGEADLSAKVSYLVCKDICVPGHATPTLKLPVSAAGGDAGEANKQLFADWAAQLPVPRVEAPWSLSQKFDPPKHSVRLDIVVPADKNAPLDVFPGPNDDVNVEAEVNPGDLDLSAEFDVTLTITPLDGHAMPLVKLPVVLGFTNADHQRRGIITEIDLSKLKPADSKPPHA
jgi:thiol:disulfide interchange protein DsbD